MPNPPLQTPYRGLPVNYLLKGLVLFIASLILLGPPSEVGHPMEPSQPTSIQELHKYPQRFDGTGWIRSIEFQRGRMGSRFLKFTIEETESFSSRNTPPVNVFISTFPTLKVGEYVWVQGIYHHHGRMGGHPYQFFIDADFIQKTPAL